MKRKLTLLGILLVLVLGGVVSYLWWRGTFSQAPGTVLVDTFNKANAGDYDGVFQNLISKARSFYADKSDLFKATCDAITRNGSIDRIYVERESPPIGDICFVTFHIRYKDQATQTVTETMHLESGRWRLQFLEVIGKLAPDFDIDSPAAAKTAIQASKVQLSKEFVPIPGTGVSIQLLDGCEWNENTNRFEDNKLGPAIGADYSGRKSLKEFIEETETIWRETGRDPGQPKKVRIGNFEGVFYEFDNPPNIKGYKWRNMLLVVGTDRESVCLTAMIPPIRRLVRLSRESLMSAKWIPRKKKS